MDILITDTMLREFLETEATPNKIAECLSLCGPSIEKITKEENETVYHIEVTGNRVDMASAIGIAREAVAILPQFGIKAKLKEPAYDKPKYSTKKLEINITPDKKLCDRFVAVKLSEIKIGEAPKFIQTRLKAIGQRPVNNVVDVTNYLMFTLGVPMHAFDYDKIGNKIVVREAKRGEKFRTLDGTNHSANGHEIVFDNGKKEIIDVPGVMGTQNTAISMQTKNILLVFEHMDPLKIRETSLRHELRTNASIINEKDPDPNLIDNALTQALGFFETHLKAKIDSRVFDWYPSPRKSTQVKIERETLNSLLGINLTDIQITKILKSLMFELQIENDSLTVLPPTFRAKDITIPEDIVEEIARVYGYFNLPSVMLSGALPLENRSTEFKFENRVKEILSGFGGSEVYTLSMVSEQMVDALYAFKIKNPLGNDGAYMRTSLTPSLLMAAQDNRQESGSFHLFEVSHVYLKEHKGKGPKEEMRLAGVFGNSEYRHAKGVLEALFSILGINTITPKLEIQSGYFIYEYKVEELKKAHTPYGAYKEIPQFPEQVEDITVELKKNTKVGDILTSIQKSSENVVNVFLTDIYEDKYTFRVSFQDPNKTLTNEEVSTIREKVLLAISEVN